MARVKFKKGGLKKVGPREQMEVEAGEIVTIPDGYLARYGDRIEIVHGEGDETPPASEEVKAEAIEKAATAPKKAAKKKAAKKG